MLAFAWAGDIARRGGVAGGAGVLVLVPIAAGLLEQRLSCAFNGGNAAICSFFIAMDDDFGSDSGRGGLLLLLPGVVMVLVELDC